MKNLKIFQSTKMFMAMALIAIFGISNVYAEKPKAKTSSMTVVEIASSNDQFSILGIVLNQQNINCFKISHKNPPSILLAT